MNFTPFQQLFNFNPSIQNQWALLGDTPEKDGYLSSQLKEQVRKTLAQKNGCQYCKAKGMPDPSIYGEKTTVCTAYAEAFLHSKGQLSPKVTEVLNDYLSKEERDELIVFICFTTASQYIGALMQLLPE